MCRKNTAKLCKSKEHFLIVNLVYISSWIDNQYNIFLFIRKKVKVRLRRIDSNESQRPVSISDNVLAA